ncbi:unnamed protein product [Acanthoscelides obtectus]|uniref:Uncharacterized protein n=1 Tax=Acanthoscelides obtectus TaxID=200917 RepID=A0A9P0KM02_ACAOB|nr:unnamed protein product [Acanthoscelides obtectus]CAK1648170.1 Sjoegren syndrome nuclear autoantigen 1 homolog [Acanthoscelides obtectus]
MRAILGILIGHRSTKSAYDPLERSRRGYLPLLRLETEMERITYKLCLLNKSLAQRINAKTCYDKTLEEMEEKYANLVKDSAELLKYIREEFGDLESMLNKKTSTDEGPTGGYVVDTQASGERGKTCKCKPLREKLIPDRYIEKDPDDYRALEPDFTNLLE